MTPIAIEIERPDFLPVETMKKLLKASQMPYKLIFGLMAMGGLRVSECTNLRKQDVRSRVITIMSPKSGAKSEIAVVPSKLAVDLAVYSYNRKPGEKIFGMTDRSVLNAVHSISEKMGLDKMKNHSLRKWAISYWARKNEPGMEAFVSRHSAVKLRDRYVSPLSANEAIEKQTIMEKEFYEKEVK
jgi:integrase